MLTLEYLLEEAQLSGTPTNKRRAVLREYLQTIVLNTIYRGKHGSSMFFCGGTALRFFHRLPRFSEDLDFNTKTLTADGFKHLIKDIKSSLDQEGFSASAGQTSRDTLLSANIVFEDVMSRYGITDQREASIAVKLETNKPPWPIHTESHVLSMYGYNFTAVLTSNSGLVSEKTCALMERTRGRDIYDLLFMLRKRFPFDLELLKARGVQEPKKRIIERLNGLSEKDLQRLAKQVQPFLFKEDDTELILKAPQYAEKFLEEY